MRQPIGHHKRLPVQGAPDAARGIVGRGPEQQRMIVRRSEESSGDPMTELVLIRLVSRRVRGVLVPRVGPVWSARRARHAADVIDARIDNELEGLQTIPVHQRTKPAEVLTLLVALAKTYRAYAQGGIDRAELRAREQHTARLLNALHKQDRGQQDRSQTLRRRDRDPAQPSLTG